MDESEKRRLQNEEKKILKKIDMHKVFSRLGVTLEKDRYSSNYHSPFRDDGTHGDFNIRQEQNGEWSGFDFPVSKKYDNINIVETVNRCNYVTACKWLRDEFGINVFATATNPSTRKPADRLDRNTTPTATQESPSMPVPMEPACPAQQQRPHWNLLAAA